MVVKQEQNARQPINGSTRKNTTQMIVQQVHLCCVPIVLLFVLCTYCAIICVVYLLYYHLCFVPVVSSMIVQQVHNTHDSTTGTQHKWYYNRYTTQIIVQQVHNTNDSHVVLSFVLCTCCAIICVVYLLCYYLCCVPIVLSYVSNNSTIGTQHK
jgi:hypothetical protein